MEKGIGLAFVVIVLLNVAWISFVVWAIWSLIQILSRAVG